MPDTAANLLICNDEIDDRDLFTGFPGGTNRNATSTAEVSKTSGLIAARVNRQEKIAHVLTDYRIGGFPGKPLDLNKLPGMNDSIIKKQRLTNQL
jgi:hypothetical protein